jgi:hypoxanthine phosphoribosyltransferase
MGAGPVRQTPPALADAECLVHGAEVEAAIARLAQRLTADCAAQHPLLLCVVKGGIVFCGKLLTQLPFPLELDYVHATRYDDTTRGGEQVAWKALPATPLAGRHVLLVDDILDVGATLLAIEAHCLAAGAASVRSVVLVEKQHARKARAGLRADYAALTVPDRYVFGYGMDLHGLWRNAPGIYALRDGGAEGACSR